MNGHPSATGRAQVRESLPAKDRRSTAVPRDRPVLIAVVDAVCVNVYSQWSAAVKERRYWSELQRVWSNCKPHVGRRCGVDSRDTVQVQGPWQDGVGREELATQPEAEHQLQVVTDLTTPLSVNGTSGYMPFIVGTAIFKSYLFRHLQWELATDHGFLN